MTSIDVTLWPDLDTARKNEVRMAITTLEAADGITVPVTLEDESVDDRSPLLLLARDDDDLVGLAVIPNDIEPEIAIAVVPDRRRQGIGGQLMAAVEEVLQEQGTASALYVADMAYAGAASFCTALGLSFVFAEYRLVCSVVPAEIPVPADLVFRRAYRDDEATLIRVQAQAFDRPLAAAGEHIDAGLRETHRHFVLAEVGGQAVGMVRRGEWDGIGDITSLGVLPEWRGRGIGRAMLLDATRFLFAEGHAVVALEVATDNPTALGLYQSVGYAITNQFGYFARSEV